MPAHDEHLNRDSILDRLTEQRDALARHLRELERQVVETSQHLAAVNETIRRQREGRP